MKKYLILVGILCGTALVVPSLRSAKSQDRVNKAPRGKQAHERVFVGDLPVSVKGVKPHSLRIYNSPQFTAEEDIQIYAGRRRIQLANLAAATPNNEIEVAVSPSRKLLLEDFERMAREQGLAFDELSLDLFVGDKWDRMVWFDRTTSLIDISRDAGALIRRIVEIESSAPAATKSGSPVESSELPLDRVRVAVRFARGRLKAASALKLQEDPAILLVDPITDISENFRGQANEIKIVQMPHLYVEKEGKFGTLYTPENVTKRNLKTKGNERQ
jgi:hypothetical protein